MSVVVNTDDNTGTRLPGDSASGYGPLGIELVRDRGSLISRHREYGT